MKILQVALGRQHDIRDAFLNIGDVIYWDWSGHDRTFNRDIRKLVDQHRPDFIWLQIQTPGIINEDTAKYIRRNATVVNWTGDVRQDIQWFVQIGRHIDRTLFTNETDVRKLRSMGVQADYLQIGFPERIFTPTGDAKQCPDIIFMGNYTRGFPLSEYRRQMVEYLRQKYGQRFAVYGNSWGGSSYAVGDQHEEAAYYRGCKVAINLSHFNYSRYSSDRIFRLMGAGAFCLSHHYAELEEDFTIGEHLDVWNTFDGLSYKIDYYLDHQEERQRIAAAGSAHVHANCTWSVRVRELNQLLK